MKNPDLIHAFRKFSDSLECLTKELEKANYPASEEYGLERSFDEVAQELYHWAGTHVLILENEE